MKKLALMPLGPVDGSRLWIECDLDMWRAYGADESIRFATLKTRQTPSEPARVVMLWREAVEPLSDCYRIVARSN